MGFHVHRPFPMSGGTPRSALRVYHLASARSLAEFRAVVHCSSGPILGLDVGSRHIGVAMSDRGYVFSPSSISPLSIVRPLRVSAYQPFGHFQLLLFESTRKTHSPPPACDEAMGIFHIARLTHCCGPVRPTSALYVLARRWDGLSASVTFMIEVL